MANLWEVASIIDYWLLNGEVVVDLLGKKSGERIVKYEHVDSRITDFQLTPYGLFVRVTAGQRYQDLCLLDRCIKCLSVHHSKRDALWFWGEDPADDGAAVGGGDWNGAIATWLDKQLTGTIAKLRNLIYI